MKILLSIILMMMSIDSSTERKARLGQAFTAGIAEEVSIEGERLRIKFEAVTDDSRCPEGVDCIWSGNAEVILKMTGSESNAATIKLNTHIEPKEARYRGYSIKLVRLDPYPKKDQQIDPARYRATIAVTKK
jgi:hypothetical protein